MRHSDWEGSPRDSNVASTCDPTPLLYLYANCPRDLEMNGPPSCSDISRKKKHISIIVFLR